MSQLHIIFNSCAVGLNLMLALINHDQGKHGWVFLNVSAAAYVIIVSVKNLVGNAKEKR